MILWLHDMSRCAIAAPILPVPHTPIFMLLSFVVRFDPGARAGNLMMPAPSSLSVPSKHAKVLRKQRVVGAQLGDIPFEDCPAGCQNDSAIGEI